MWRTVAFGMNPRRNRSTHPSGSYLLGLTMTTRRPPAEAIRPPAMDASTICPRLYARGLDRGVHACLTPPRREGLRDPARVRDEEQVRERVVRVERTGFVRRRLSESDDGERK